MDLVKGVGSPARSVWFDMAAKTEHVLAPGEAAPGADNGFLWVDLELGDDPHLAPLVEPGLLNARVLEDDYSAGEVRWEVGATQVHLVFAGGQMEGDTLVLDRRHVLITPGVLATVHRGLPDHFDAPLPARGPCAQVVLTRIDG